MLWLIKRSLLYSFSLIYHDKVVSSVALLTFQKETNSWCVSHSCRITQAVLWFWRQTQNIYLGACGFATFITVHGMGKIPNELQASHIRQRLPSLFQEQPIALLLSFEGWKSVVAYEWFLVCLRGNYKDGKTRERAENPPLCGDAPRGGIQSYARASPWSDRLFYAIYCLKEMHKRPLVAFFFLNVM